MRHDLTRVGLALAVLAAAVTYPLVVDAARALPSDLGDPLLGTFILGWDADRMLHGFRGLWTAPFFFPQPDTLALSEHLLGVGIFTAPIIWLTGNPVLAYNLAFFASYILAGLGMYVLAKSLWGRRDAAFLAALAFAFAPLRVMHLPHLQVLMAGWMPLSLWGLHRYLATGSRRSLFVFAVAYALLGLSNGYFLYFFTVPVAVVVGGHLCRTVVPRWRGDLRLLGWRDSLALAGAALAILAVIAPVAAAYVRVRRAAGYHRSIEEMVHYGARLSDYLRIPDTLRLWSGTLRVGEGERTLFPGLTIIMLAALAACSLPQSAWTGTEGRPARWRWHVGTYAAVLAMAAWLAAGPAMPGPYGLLLRVLPGFDGLRVPARFIVIIVLALAVLGSAGAAWLLGRLRPRAATAVAILLGGAIALEGYGGPIEMVPFGHDQRTRTALNNWLRQAPPGGVLELPIAGPDLEPFTLEYQYNTLRHGHPIVNGYGGYGYGLQDFLGGPGSPLNDPAAIAGCIAGLRAIGVRYVLVHRATYSDVPEFGWPDPNTLVEAIDAAPGTTGPGRPFNDVMAWTLTDAPARTPVDEASLVRLPASAFVAEASLMPDRLRYAFDERLETKWLSGRPQEAGEWVRLSFANDTDVGRLVVLTPRGGVGDFPRGLTVESETGDGSRITLFAGSFLPFLVRGLSGPLPGAPAVIDLPSNMSRAVWLRQTGRSARWQWAIHELQVYERRHSAP